MSGWVTFWKWACIVGMGSFFAMALLVIPFGARDIARLFRDLGSGGQPPGGRQQPGSNERPA
ncbi:MAG TPA: hypothetical protein PLE19_15005 [Planctomycetota bacterium]|nr:hypothetical protein [Planctomycetota bacterium]HRR80584.1 hypothetical protein [Planctomycetota bacterium]HRT94429.1 hypothetical protein [Planctomycetota bacterium]